MAFARCLQLPLNSIYPKPSLPHSTTSSSTSFPLSNKHQHIYRSTQPKLNLTNTTRTRREIRQHHRLVVRSTSTQDDPETQNTGAGIETSTTESPPSNLQSSEGTAASDGSSGGGEVELSELGKEIKKMIKEREGEEKEGINQYLSGVAEEIREIEWPDFDKVVRTTGVVIGVIAGSSVVLLTVNAILAELSDRIFAGRGIQDFFG